jgi:signal transduction histidine kinase
MRIHQDKGVRIELDCAPGLKFRGERQDLEEMGGNLMDNACKWAVKNISVEVRNIERMEGGDGRSQVEIAVSDDGPGLPVAKRAEALKRGRRLDETKPGSGLGLNIVAETAAMYGGTVKLEDSRLGGLKAVLRLPSVN